MILGITFALWICRSTFAYDDVYIQDRNLFECGGATMSTTNCPTDGKEVDNEQSEEKFVSAQVAIMRRKYAEGSFEYRCSGVLVTRRHVLTAAWCFYKTKYEKSYEVRIGSTDFNEGKSYAVQDIAAHEAYIYGSHKDNLALVTLVQAVEDPKVGVVCLPDETMSEKELTGLELHMAGWGRVPVGDDLGNYTFNINRMRTTSDKEWCNQIQEMNFYPEIKSGLLLAFLVEGEIHACVGARGSSLMLLRGDRWYVVGIRSLMPDCSALKYYPIVFAELSVYADWIRTKIQLSLLNSQFKLK